ncbi:hypothetical protein [Pantoea ananatis]|uniref:hypothetical protein n=1 Tax=Pantoea ananas TaxID=553 RepID=UPI0024B751AF|nr:hypothetical protein [Pantoea ananatis]MDJ0030307.1 hypothetical protein [Pantoea ananatis]
MTTNSPNPVDGDVIKELRSRYAEPKIPSCSICGGELSVQRSGGGSPTIWACSGMIDDPTGERTWIYAEGRSCADEHYERSRWTDYRRGGDSDVIDLIDAYQALLDERLNATPQPVSAPEWTNEQCLEFLSIAFRHANISGDIEMDDIRLGIRMVNAAVSEKK